MTESRTHIVFVLLLAAALTYGCTGKETCQSLVERAEFEQAMTVCLRDYRQNHDSDALMNWIAAAATAKPADIPQVIDSMENQSLRADAQLTAADYARRDGNTEQARKYYRSSADFFAANAFDAELARAYHGLYFLAQRSSNYREALAFAADSLDASKRANDDEAEVIALQDLFRVFENLGNLGPAQRALELIDEKLQDTISPRRINAYISQGLLHLQRNEFGFAAHQFDLALAAASGSKNRSALRGLHLNIVHANMELGRLDKANDHMKTAWSYANPDNTSRFALLYYQAKLLLRVGDFAAAREHLLLALTDTDVPPVWIWQMHYRAGQAALGIGDLDGAIESYSRSAGALERLRADVAFNELKAPLLARRRQPYEALFRAYVDADRTLDAFVIAEQAKSRSFVDAFIASSDADIGTPNEFPVTEVADRFDSVRAYVSAMRTSPVARPRDGTEVLQRLGDRTVIVFFLAEDRLFALKAGSGDVVIHEIDATAEARRETLHRYRENPNDPNVLTKLGNWLFPAHLLPEEGTHLYIAPGRFVSEVALAGLRVDDQFLIERHTLSLVPSASALVAMLEEESPLDHALPSVVVGDPNGDLPAAREEARIVADILNVAPLSGDDATMDRVFGARELAVLHVAAHSGISHLGPWLRLAGRDVQGNELLRHAVKPKLAVLASCASGAGDRGNFWGSLGGLLLSGGADSVIVTLWSVEDNDTRELIGDFYRGYSANSMPSIALANAQRRAIAQGRAPRSWAAFAVLGDAGLGR